VHALVQPGAIESRSGRRAQADRRRDPPLHCRGGRRRRRGPGSWCRPGRLCPAHCLSSGLACGPPQRQLRRAPARSQESCQPVCSSASLFSEIDGKGPCIVVSHGGQSQAPRCPPWGTNRRDESCPRR
jgi:hypothetical protein